MKHGHLRLVAAAFLLVGLPASALAAPGLNCRSVAASGGWQSTGLTLADGDAVCIAARGVWSHGPEPGNLSPWHGPAGYLLKKERAPTPIVPFPFARIGALVGKIGEAGIAFPIEDGLCFLVRPTDGSSSLPADLKLAMNDVPASFADNLGALRVAVAVEFGEVAKGSRDALFERLAERVTRGSCLR